MCNVVRDQWRTGEVGVDGWGGGPLSQGQNAAKLCSSRHDAATRWAVGEYSRVEREGIETAVERECLAVTYLGGRRLSPSRVKKGSTAGVCRSREAEGLRTTSRRAGGRAQRTFGDGGDAVSVSGRSSGISGGGGGVERTAM